MNCEEIRKKTSIVIEKDGKYLTRPSALNPPGAWDPHLSSAWKTRNIEAAKRSAEKYGGRMMLFNPIVWRVKELCLQTSG